jgi:hypothetical protein
MTVRCRKYEGRLWLRFQLCDFPGRSGAWKAKGGLRTGALNSAGPARSVRPERSQTLLRRVLAWHRLRLVMAVCVPSAVGGGPGRPSGAGPDPKLSSTRQQMRVMSVAKSQITASIQHPWFFADPTVRSQMPTPK